MSNYGFCLLFTHLGYFGKVVSCLIGYYSGNFDVILCHILLIITKA